MRAITLDVLRHSDLEDSPEEKIAKWEEVNASRLGRARSTLQEIRTLDQPDLATLAVGARQVRSMVS
jgi:glutamate dehydrogenase